MQKKITRGREWGRLVDMCLETASTSEANTEKWKSQQGALDLLPTPLGDELVYRLVQRRIISPSLLRCLNKSVEEIDLRKHNAINDELMEILGEFRYLSSLKLADCHGVNDSSLLHICELRMLKELDLSGCEKITDTGIQRLVCIQSLEKLYISHTRLSADGVVILSCLSNLLLLDLGGIPVTDTALSSLQVLTKLEHLDLRETEISDNCVHIFESFPRLGFLNIACTEITDNGVARLSGLTNLLHLDLGGLLVTDTALSSLQVLTKLEHLDLRGSKISDNGVHIFQSFPRLSFLNIARTQITKDGVAILSCLGNLLQLDLVGINVTDTALSSLQVLTKLERLELRGSRISDDSVHIFEYFPRLSFLNIGYTKITDNGVATLSCLSNLIQLDLVGIPVTDTVLSSLQVLTKLEHLNVNGTKISDNGVCIFASFPRLVFLNIGCTNITSLPLLPSIETIIMRLCKINSLFIAGQETNPPLSKLDLSWTNFNICISTVFTSFDPSYVTFLDLSGTRNLQELSFLEKMKNLEHLDLGFSETTSAMLHAVAKVGYKLKYLDLRQTVVDSYGVSVLAGSVPNLEYLSLARTNINDGALYYIGMMTSLKTLNINNTRIYGFVRTGIITTMLSLRYLENLGKLENLKIENERMRLAALQPILKLQNLRALYLYNDCFHCETFKSFPLNPNLKYLKLCMRKMTDRFLRSFTPNKSLNTLDLSGCILLSESALKIFCRKHPQIKVIHYYLF